MDKSKMVSLNISIIILNWNGWKDTIECLESLFQIDYSNYDVVLVDNASSDHSIEKIKEYCMGELEVNSDFFKYNREHKPINILELTESEMNTNLSEEFLKLPSNKRLILLKNQKNHGFAEGNNVGIRYALKNLNPDSILLLNNDTVVDSQFLNILVNELYKNNNGIVGPCVYYYDEPDKMTYIGGDINCYTGKITHPYLDTSKKAHFKHEIDYISGCCLLVKKEVINEIGLLDPQYFLYYEDADWCLRAKNGGYKVIYVPEANIWHKVSSSIGESSKTALYYGIRNHFLLIRKNCSFKNFIIFVPVFLIRKFLFSLYILLQGDLSGFKVIISAIFHAIKGKYGFREL